MKALLSIIALLSATYVFINARNRSDEESDIKLRSKHQADGDFEWKECKKLGTSSLWLYGYAIALGLLAFAIFFSHGLNFADPDYLAQ